MSHGRFKNPIEAALAGVNDLFATQPLAEALTDDLRLDGRTVFITGGSSGLGFAVARQLAERGARVLTVARSGVPDKAQQIKRAAGHDRVEMLKADLSDLVDVHRVADWLAERGPLDVVIENAGMAAPRAKKTPQGLEAMFVTNYLGKYALINRLLRDGTIPNATYGHNPVSGPLKPRIIIVSSDSHQGASAIDWDEFGTLKEFGVNGAINNYSYFKLILNTWAVELSRRLADEGEIDVAVHVVCPGPVNTNIIREAPLVLRGALKAIFSVAFRHPDQAAGPVVYLAAHDEWGTTTNRYLHMFSEKRMDPKCYDPEEGERLWDRSRRVLEGVDLGETDLASAPA